MKLKGTMNHLKNDLIFFSNPQTKSNKTSQIEKDKKETLNNYMLKEKYGGLIIKICYVGHFIIYVIMKKLITKLLN